MFKFKRAFNPINRIYMKKTYGDLIKIDKLSRLKLRKLYEKESKTLVDNYLFYLLDKWIQNNYIEIVSFANKLKKIIKRLRLELSTIESDKLLVLDERIFSIDRHIKRLEVNTELDKKEFAGAKFSLAKLFNEKYLSEEGDLILTNKRIIFNGNNSYSFYYNKINIIKKSDHLEVELGNKKYRVQIHDNITLINTLNNIQRKTGNNEI